MQFTFFLVSGKIQKTVRFNNHTFPGAEGGRSERVGRSQCSWSAQRMASIGTAQLLEVTVLVSVTCWCVKGKNESYSSGEACICQVYCLIKPIHLSTHRMPIKLHRMVQVYGGRLVPNFITAELFWLTVFHPAKWQAYQSQIKCSWNNAFKEDEMPQPGRGECEM